MSKNEVCTNPVLPVIKNGTEYHCGWIYTQKTLDIILGNQLAIIEAIGLPDKQELAIKSQIRQALFRPQRLAQFLSSQEVADLSDDKVNEDFTDSLIDIDEIKNIK